MSRNSAVGGGRYIIINADDFGYCKERNKGIKRCLLENAVSSVSVLVNGEYADDIHLNGDANQSHSIGLHFNISEGTPLSPISAIPTLLNENHHFKGKFILHEAAAKKCISTAEVETELKAQLEAFKKLTNCMPSHVDGHQHVHILPGIREAFANVLCAENIKWTRLPVELEIDECPWLNESQRKFYSFISEMAKESSILFMDHDIQYAGSFIGMTTMGKNMTVERLKNATIKMLEKNSLCEMMVHPGYAAIPGIGGCGEGPDDFALSADREHEMEILCAKEWKNFLEREQIQRISFKEASSLFR